MPSHGTILLLGEVVGQTASTTGCPMMCSSLCLVVCECGRCFRRGTPNGTPEVAKIMEQLVAKVPSLQDLLPEELAAPACGGVKEASRYGSTSAELTRPRAEATIGQPDV
jgi:hypothetical protein